MCSLDQTLVQRLARSLIVTFFVAGKLVYIVHKIYEAPGEGSEMRAVFLNISKAFDGV